MTTAAANADSPIKTAAIGSRSSSYTIQSTRPNVRYLRMNRAAGNIDRLPSKCCAKSPFVELSSQMKLTADKSPPTTTPTQERMLPNINPAIAAAATATAISAKILAREYTRMSASGSVWTSIAKRTF